MSGPAEKRHKAYTFGVLAEGLAALYFRLKGYQVLARRFRGPAGEADLVLKRGRTLVFVEVKARTDTSSAAWAITGRQQQRIGNAARAFLAHNSQYNEFDVRFDALLVAQWRWPTHIPNAWQLEERF